jgi:hypothetical protein
VCRWDTGTAICRGTAAIPQNLCRRPHRGRLHAGSNTQMGGQRRAIERKSQGPQHPRRAGGGARATPGKGVGGRNDRDGDQVQEPAQRRDSRRKGQLQGHRCKAKGQTADERRQKQQQQQRGRNERRPSATTTNGAERQVDLLQLLLAVG